MVPHEKQTTLPSFSTWEEFFVLVGPDEIVSEAELPKPFQNLDVLFRKGTRWDSTPWKPEEQNALRQAFRQVRTSQKKAEFSLAFLDRPYRCKLGIWDQQGKVFLWLKGEWLFPVVQAGEIDQETIPSVKELLKIKQLFEQTGEVASIGAWEVDLLQNKVWWSEETKRIHGVPLDFEPDYTTAVGFFPDFIERTNLEKLIQKTIETGESYECILRLLDLQKNQKWIRTIGHGEFVNGECVRLYGTFQDINKSVLAELEKQNVLLRLQSILDATTHVSIIGTDLDGTISLFNKGAEYLLGYTAEELVGKHTPVIFHKAEEIEMQSAILSAETGENITGFLTFVYRARLGEYDSREWTYIRKDGTEFPVQLVVTAMYDSQGSITGYLGIAIDISLHKVNEDILRESTRKAEELARSKSQFLANMSHEIRTPLNGVIGFTELLQQTELTSQQKDYLNTISLSARSLLDLINDILDYSKLESHKMELFWENVNLSQLVQEISEIVKYKIWEKNLEYEFQISPETPTVVKVDSLRLKQILLNLLSNAIKFTHEGKITLKVDSKKVENSLVELRFSVKDSGIGIAKDVQTKIFEAFSQADTSTTRQYGGTGLGLSICNQLLKLFDSRLELESALNQGSEFSFSFRTTAGLDESHPSLEPRQTRELIKFTDVGKEARWKILIVEDNPINKKLTKMMVSKFLPKSEIWEANNGNEAVEFYAKHSPDLVLMDIQMPEMNGYDAAKSIRNLPNERQVPIIALTAATLNEEIEACISSGMQDYLAKPIVREALEDKIKFWLTTK